MAASGRAEWEVMKQKAGVIDSQKRDNYGGSRRQRCEGSQLTRERGVTESGEEGEGKQLCSGEGPLLRSLQKLAFFSKPRASFPHSLFSLARAQCRLEYCTFLHFEELRGGQQLRHSLFVEALGADEGSIDKVSD